MSTEIVSLDSKSIRAFIGLHGIDATQLLLEEVMLMIAEYIHPEILRIATTQNNDEKFSVHLISQKSKKKEVIH